MGHAVIKRQQCCFVCFPWQCLLMLALLIEGRIVGWFVYKSHPSASVVTVSVQCSALDSASLCACAAAPPQQGLVTC